MFLGQSITEIAWNWTVLLPVVAGALAVWYLLPTPRRRPLRYGLLGIAVAVFGFGTFLCRGLQTDLPFNAEVLLFWAFALMALTFAMLMITQRNPARAAIFFAIVVMSTCGLFLLQAAPFLMAATLIIYAGAIVVTFLFVIMLSQQTGQTDANDRSREPSLAAAVGFILLGTLLVVLQRVYVVRDDAAVVALLNDTERYAAMPDPTRELLQPAGHFTRTDFEDNPRPTRADIYLFNIKRARDRLGYGKIAIPTIFNGEPKREDSSDPVDEMRALLNLTPTLFPPISGDEARLQLDDEEQKTLKSILAQIHYELAFLRAVRHGLVMPGARAPGSPYGQAWDPKPSDDPSRIPPRRLPNANIAALGRVLFTDHLLAIELGGTLLLIATIGAIAIAGTRKENAA
jgi:NADH:ubiquinone oxidoreductase subunit 6 (subunit J)